MSRRYKKLVHEGEYAAEVEVDLIATDEGWSPYLPLEDAERLDPGTSWPQRRLSPR